MISASLAEMTSSSDVGWLAYILPTRSSWLPKHLGISLRASRWSASFSPFLRLFVLSAG